MRRGDFFYGIQDSGMKVSRHISKHSGIHRHGLCTEANSMQLFFTNFIPNHLFSLAKVFKWKMLFFCKKVLHVCQQFCISRRR